MVDRARMLCSASRSWFHHTATRCCWEKGGHGGTRHTTQQWTVHLLPITSHEPYVRHTLGRASVVSCHRKHTGRKPRTEGYRGRLGHQSNAKDASKIIRYRPVGSTLWIRLGATSAEKLKVQWGQTRSGGANGWNNRNALVWARATVNGTNVDVTW
ncbi:hypothetical protein ZHAS_00021772 [Anopheles sinensis]|uniref:Uncharacterized protein n=1 Tax=Anopheles sinensis TaxID=74873 RepID=A0A084WT67_ANOSI|nr:hypothetical protein ZHAS_00021772 [Anopheles sinensis]